MGNQVVFSVSYDHLDDLEGKDFEVFARQIHESPRIPRFLNNDVIGAGIAFSHYSHSGDGVVVAVSGQGITQPSIAFALTSSDIEDGRLGILKGLKRASKYMLDEPYSVRRAKSKAPVTAPVNDTRSMVFGYLTDNSSSLLSDKALLSKIVDHMRDPVNNRLPHHIKKISLLEPGDQVLIKMHGNSFIPSDKFMSSNKLIFSRWAEDVGFEDGSLKDSRLSDVWVSKLLMADLGYDLSPMSDKTITKELSENVR